jgi:hypothetical protein
MIVFQTLSNLIPFCRSRSSKDNLSLANTHKNGLAYHFPAVTQTKQKLMKHIWLATTVILLTAAMKTTAQDNTVRKTDSTTVTTQDTTVATPGTSVTTPATTVTKSTSVTTESNTSNVKTTSEKTGLRVGLRAGVNSSNIKKSGSTNIDFKNGAKTGFNAALFLEIPVVTAFSVQPEVQFSQKGYKASGTYSSAPYEYKQTTNFIEIPLLAKFKPTENFAVVIGPQFSFLTSTKTKVTVANTSHESLVKMTMTT